MVKAQTHARVISVLKKEDGNCVVTLRLPNNKVTNLPIFTQVTVKNCILTPGIFIRPNDIIGD